MNRFIETQPGMMTPVNDKDEPRDEHQEEQVDNEQETRSK